MQLLGTGKQRSAKTSRVCVTNTFLTFASWSVNMSGADLDTGNFESFNVAAGQSYEEGILGFLGCKVTFGGDWDAGTDPYGSVPGLYPRDDLGGGGTGNAGVAFYTSRLDVIFWSFPYLRIRGTTNGGEVKGKVTFAVGDAQSQGSFTFPTGSV